MTNNARNKPQKTLVAAKNAPQQDGILAAAILILIGLGIVMVASSTMHLSADAPFQYVYRHLVALALGLCAATLAYQIPTHWWDKGSLWLYGFGSILLILVLMPEFGHSVNGAQRWIDLQVFTLQPAELMKVFAVLYLASYLARQRDDIETTLWGFFKPFLILSVACGLISAQPDFGTAAVLIALTFALLFLARAPLKNFLIPGLIALLVIAGFIYFEEYRMARVTSFINPWEYAADEGYQLTQSLIAFGRGEWFGVGLGNSLQKQFYLPEAHTDFMLAVIGEEFGLIGTLVVIGLFSLIIWRAFAIARQAQQANQDYAAYLAYGLGLYLGIQAYLNIGVNLGVLPTKGLTLPFLSFGGNSLIVCLIACGLLFRVHRENQQGPTT